MVHTVAVDPGSGPKVGGWAADNWFVDRCAHCGAVLAAGAGWCGQCFAPIGGAAGAPAASAAAAAPATTPFAPTGAQPRELLTRSTRWAKTPTTFGPAGRVLCTVGVLVPLLVMIVGGFVDMFAWGGAAVYGAVIVPWAMRDIWKAGQVRVG